VFARSLPQHRELILNYFRAQKPISSGALELALYQSPGKLPEPESTHDFF
jgi:hypothetical protein